MNVQGVVSVLVRIAYYTQFSLYIMMLHLL